MRKILLLFAACLGLVMAPRMNAQTSGPTLKKVTESDLPGPGGKRFDYLAIDTDDHYLFSAHLAAGQTYVINLRTNQVVATVTDTPGVEGIEYVDIQSLEHRFELPDNFFHCDLQNPIVLATYATFRLTILSW
jgi:hypothetical protein